MGELEEAHTPHGGQIAVRKNGDRDGRLGRAGAAGSEQLCFDPYAGGPAAHDDGVAARRAAVSHRAIFQLREGERLVPHPRHDFGAADDGNGCAVTVVPQRPAAMIVELESEPPCPRHTAWWRAAE